MGLWHADLLVTKSSVKSDAILHSFSANRLIKFKKLIIFPSGSSPRGLMWINREPFKSYGVFFFFDNLVQRGPASASSSTRALRFFDRKLLLLK